MDLNGGRRQSPLIEEPKRPPWMLIILLVAAAVVIMWAITSLRFEIERAPLPPAPPVAADDRIEVRPASPSQDKLVVVPSDETVRPAVDAPRWARQPVPYFPREGVRAPGGEGRVTVSCVIQSNHGLGDCVVVREDPAGYGFGEAAIRAARRARLTDEARPGGRIIYTTRFVKPE